VRVFIGLGRADEVGLEYLTSKASSIALHLFQIGGTRHAIGWLAGLKKAPLECLYFRHLDNIYQPDNGYRHYQTLEYPTNVFFC